MVDFERSARNFGIWVILLTLLFRLFAAGLPQSLLRQRNNSITQDNQTGQNVRSLSFGFGITPLFRRESIAYPPESAPPTDIPRQPELPAFQPEDGDTVALTNSSDKSPDLGELIARPLECSLAGQEPTVLILHTHTTECYTRSEGEEYDESSAYRTLAEEYNMLCVGDRVAELLEQAGIPVIHDRQLHDYPSYTGAYNHARKATQAALEEYPTIRIVLDLHRDAAEGTSGQLRTVAQIDGKSGAQLMFVVGCGNAGLKHPNWEENLSLALKLQFLLEEQHPGICRPISLRNQRFNQDLSTGALLIEVGAAGNTHEEALLAAQALAEAVIRLKNGTESDRGLQFLKNS